MLVFFTKIVREEFLCAMDLSYHYKQFRPVYHSWVMTQQNIARYADSKPEWLLFFFSIYFFSLQTWNIVLMRLCHKIFTPSP